MLFVCPSMKNENKDEQSEDYKPDCWLHVHQIIMSVTHTSSFDNIVSRLERN